MGVQARSDALNSLTTASISATSQQTPRSSAAHNGVALLDLRVFKVEKCSKETRHNQKKCFYYHQQD